MRNPPEIAYTIILATIFFVLLAVVIVVTVWRYYLRKRTHEMAVMEFDHTLLQTRLEIQEQTFRTISQELHDNLGQLLSLAKLHLTTLKMEKPEEIQEKVNGAIDLVSESIQSIRDLAKTMHSESINRVGLMPALETEIRMMQKLGVIQPVFRVTGIETSLPDNMNLIIFRIVQEALHNVTKHAEATLVELSVGFLPKHLSVTVRDNGKGYSGVNNGDGSGLRNMRDRARIIGADLTVTSAEGEGTLITLTIPSP